MKSVQLQIEARDRADRNRVLAPLARAIDAPIIDNGRGRTPIGITAEILAEAVLRHDPMSLPKAIQKRLSSSEA